MLSFTWFLIEVTGFAVYKTRAVNSMNLED